LTPPGPTWSVLGSPYWRAEYDRTTADEARAMLPVAQAELLPASGADVSKAAMILAGLPSRGLDADGARLALAVYKSGLDDMPADLIDLAVRRALKSCRFRPSPAELRELIAEEWDERRARLNRLRRIVDEAAGDGTVGDATGDERAAA
jgi:hypothetical protein